MLYYSTGKMSRGLKAPWHLLHLSKGLNNNNKSLIKNNCVNKGFASFSSVCCFKLISHGQEVRQLTSFHLTPDRPSVDEHFELEVCTHFHIEF